MSRLIVHISEIDIMAEGGMGRVEYHWKQAFQDESIEFIHIGPKEIGNVYHKALFPYKAYSYYKRLNIKPSAVIAHEPASGLFIKENIPCFLESHGVETRYWKDSKNGLTDNVNISLKTRIAYPLWRLYNCSKGLKRAHKLLLINTDDKNFVMKNYNRADNDIFIFRNGVTPHIKADGFVQKKTIYHII